MAWLLRGGFEGGCEFLAGIILNAFVPFAIRSALLGDADKEADRCGYQRAKAVAGADDEGGVSFAFVHVNFRRAMGVADNEAGGAVDHAIVVIGEWERTVRSFTGCGRNGL